VKEPTDHEMMALGLVQWYATELRLKQLVLGER